MDSKLIKEIIDSQEPIAIIKYFEWPIFSNDYTHARYAMLRIDSKHNDIHEIDIPFNLVPFVISQTDRFKEALRLSEGVVWERKEFREMVKSSVSKVKIHQVISQA